MHSSSLFLYVALGLTQLTQAIDPHVKIASSRFLGNITSSCGNVVRDLGFHGQIGAWNINTYGDTLSCGNVDNQENCLTYASNTAGASTSDPLKVDDFECTSAGRAPPQFCPNIAEWGEKPNSAWAIGLGNVVATGWNSGVVYTTRVYHPTPGGLNNYTQANTVIGQGISTVDTSGDKPKCTRFAKQWWDGATEPTWGSQAAVPHPDGHIYLFGGMVDVPDQFFLARVPKDKALDLSAYEYWHGISGFQKERLLNPNKDKIVLPDSTMGSILWSPYLNTWISISRSVKDLLAVTMRTAHFLSGPWSDEVTLYRSDQGFLIYAPTVHPSFDESMKTMVISYTVFPNLQQAAKVELA